VYINLSEFKYMREIKPIKFVVYTKSKGESTFKPIKSFFYHKQ